MKLAAIALSAFTLAFGLTLSSVGEARDGNESHGGGTETPLLNGPAWFMGKEHVVQACVELLPGFRLVPDTEPRPQDPANARELTRADAIRLLEEAHAKWITYITERGWLQPENNPKEPEFTSQLHVLPACNGQEDLKVYFGAEDAVVRKAKAKFREPYGFADHAGKAERPLWRKGIIWIAPPGLVGKNRAIWTFRRLSGELLHELGHTFGNEHVPGTVMDANLGRIFSEEPGEYYAPDSLVDQIDQERALAHGQELQRMSRRIDWADEHRDDTFQPLVPFRHVMKRPHQGVISEDVEVRKMPATEIGGDERLVGSFHLGDEAGGKDFRLEAHSPFACTGLGEIFKHELPDYVDWVAGGSSVSCQYIGEITDTLSGESFPIAIEQDSLQERFKIKLTDIPDYFGLFDFRPPWNTACEPNPDCSLITRPHH